MLFIVISTVILLQNCCGSLLPWIDDVKDVIEDEVNKHFYRRIPNINYLGRGYNIIKGDPIPLHGGADAGFTQSIVDFSYDELRKSNDDKYRIPDYVQVFDKHACSFKAHSETTTGETSYADQRMSSVKLSGGAGFGFAKVSFSASVGMKKMSKSTSKTKRIFISATGYCSAYDSVLETASFKVSDEFKKQVNMLPSTIDITQKSDPYYQFLEKYGTHYTTGLEMGSQYTRTYEFTQSGYSEMTSKVTNIATAIEASYGVATGDAAFNSQSAKSTASNFEEKTTDTIITVLGNNPPSDGDLEDYQSDAITNPYPFKYTLAPISDLFTMNKIIDGEEKELRMKKENLEKALTNYCSNALGDICHEHAPDVGLGSIIYPAGYFGLRSADGTQSKCLTNVGTVNKDSAVGLTTCLSTPNYQRFEYLEEQEIIKTRNTRQTIDQCLEWNGSAVRLTPPCHAGTNQRWIFKDNGEIRVKSKEGYCLTVVGQDFTMLPCDENNTKQKFVTFSLPA